MAGTIVADIIQSDQSYASSINIASPMVVSNTISMTNGAISGNVNFDSGTLFVNTVADRVSVGKTTNLGGKFEVAAGTDEQFFVGSSRRVGWLNDAGTSWVNSQWNGLSHTFNVGQYASVGAMNIDSSGRVTMPYQPAFRATGSATYVTRSAPVNYDTTSLNIGSHYNTSTYRFTAPVVGHYFFHASAIAETTSVAGGINLRVNGTTQARGYNSTNERNRVVTTTFYLNVGDYVDVGLEDISVLYLGQGYGYFLGFLIG